MASHAVAGNARVTSRAVRLGPLGLPGDLRRPEQASGLVVFVHGSGSSRLSPRNRYVAATLNDRGLATLLFDLLTEDEAVDRRRVFDIPLLFETQRERDVLRLLADGLSNEEIGKELFISPETVRTHVRKAMEKLDADTRTQAVATALRQSLIA